MQIQLQTGEKKLPDNEIWAEYPQQLVPVVKVLEKRTLLHRALHKPKMCVPT